MRVITILVAALALAGCRTEGEGFSQQQPPPPPVDPDTLCIDPGLTRCDGAAFQVCTSGRWIDQQTCSGATPVCDPVEGCSACLPETTYCAGDEIWSCDAAGDASRLHTCAETEECILGSCWDRCAQAEGTNSYLGCRFLAVATANVLAADFDHDFAVVVGNPSRTTAADVSIRRGGSLVASGSVPPQSTEAFELAMVPALQDYSASSRVAGAAYEVATTLPVAAYQYNPLHFQAGSEYSFTNDASLLLPEHVLSGNYRVTSMPTLGLGEFPGQAEFVPGFLAVAATEDGTLVELRSTAFTLAGSFGELAPGESTVVSLDRGDVLQVFSLAPAASANADVCAELGGTLSSNGVHQSCRLGADGDLTGSVIAADKDVAVWSGHVCSFVPFDRWACDHLEEGMFPVETWGRRFVLTAPMRPEGGDVAPTLYRVLADEDGTELTFSGGVHADVALDAGGLLEFTAYQDFVLDSSRRVSVSQALLGQNALSSSAGDPALGSGVPQAQWRDEYDFLVPETYTSNYVNLVAPRETRVYLDGTELTGWEPVPDSDQAVLRWSLEPGSHRLESVGDVGFGLTSYGYAVYTSYLYPGGMNFLRGTTR